MRRRVSILALMCMFGVFAAATPAAAVKPSQGSTFEQGTCTTTSGHGSKATQTSDPGNCQSADNPNQGGFQTGTNTGHGFVAD